MVYVRPRDMKCLCNRMWPNLARRYFWVVESVGSNPIILTNHLMWGDEK